MYIYIHYYNSCIGDGIFDGFDGFDGLDGLDMLNGFVGYLHIYLL